STATLGRSTSWSGGRTTTWTTTPSASWKSCGITGRRTARRANVSPRNSCAGASRRTTSTGSRDVTRLLLRRSRLGERGQGHDAHVHHVAARPLLHVAVVAQGVPCPPGRDALGPPSPAGAHQL